MWATLLSLHDKNILTTDNGHHDAQTDPTGHRFSYPVGAGCCFAEDWIDQAQGAGCCFAEDWIDQAQGAGCCFAEDWIDQAQGAGCSFC
jgi:hypothetical protein